MASMDQSKANAGPFSMRVGLTEFATSSEELGRKLYMTYRDFLSVQIYYRIWDADLQSTNSVEISDASTGSQPALAVFNGKLYMVYEGGEIVTDNRIRYRTLDGLTSSWSDELIIPYAYTTFPPALAVYGDKLYLVYRGPKTDDKLYFSTFDGTNWSDVVQLPNSLTSDSPALAVYNEKLYLAYREAESGGPSERLWYTTYDAKNSKWSQDSQIPNVLLSGSPALAVFNGNLYLAHRGAGSIGQASHLWCTRFDGTKWSNDRALEIKTDASPALTMFGSRLAVAGTGDSPVTFLNDDTMD